MRPFRAGWGASSHIPRLPVEQPATEGSLDMDVVVRSEMETGERDAFVLAALREHAASMLRVARRHSWCADDAEDAYQRAVEIFLRHAGRLDREAVGGWLRTVTKHEAMA